MNRDLAPRLVPRLVFLACVLGVHAATMALLDREDIVGRALGAQHGVSSVVVLGLFTFLLLRVFVWVFLPGFVFFWIVDTAASLRPTPAAVGDGRAPVPGQSSP